MKKVVVTQVIISSNVDDVLGLVIGELHGNTIIDGENFILKKSLVCVQKGW